jgi:hypothetical protein
MYARLLIESLRRGTRRKLLAVTPLFDASAPHHGM